MAEKEKKATARRQGRKGADDTTSASLRQALAALLGAELMFGDEEMLSSLRQAGVKRPTNADGIGFAILAKASQGDSNALRLLRDLCPEGGGVKTPEAAEDLSALSDEELRRLAAAEE